MASSGPDTAGTPTDIDIEPGHRHDSESSESVASSASEDASRHSSCPWRTDRFHHQECSRYFDCPAHTLERPPSSPTNDHPVQPRSLENIQRTPNAGNEAEATSSLTAARDRPLPPQPVEDQVLSDHEGTTGLDQRMAPLAHRPRQSSASRLPPSPGRPERFEFRPGAERTLIPLGYGALPPLPHSRSRPHPGSRRPSEYIPPRWQADAEVTYCPICQTQFSFFVRKHHCRKCGRVVCNACSPHRIIIPHQYIVRPPGYELPPESLLMDQLGVGYVDVHGSGGERVRLCNPCVPDPNVAPPSNSPGTLPPTSSGLARVPHQRSRSSIGDAYGAAVPSHRYGVVYASGQQHDAFQNSAPRHRSVTLSPGTHAMPPSSSRARPGPSTFFPGTHSRDSTSASSSSVPSYPTRYSSLRQGRSSPRHRNLPPTPQIAEEDECPICHRELPKRTLPDFSTLREEHINACIQSHSTYGSPMPRPDGGTPEQTAAAPRRTGMYTYPATEKDCIDDAECTICLEEFTVGVPMARLECLCRFHRSCITAWFVNHPGRCPVHQHDGFGY